MTNEKEHDGGTIQLKTSRIKINEFWRNILQINFHKSVCVCYRVWLMQINFMSKNFTFLDQAIVITY